MKGIIFCGICLLALMTTTTNEAEAWRVTYPEQCEANGCDWVGYHEPCDCEW